MRLINAFLFLSVLAITFSCDENGSSDNFNSPQSSGSGQGGSMTRFAIQGNYMYIVDASSIKVFEVESGKFNLLPEVPVGFGIETIFAKGEYLYLGANDAMYIYSISNPEAPEFIFRYSHIVSCDPVVVQGNRAYVTLSSGSRCNRGTNSLEIIDITNPYDPHLVVNYQMESPRGLAIDGKVLFICEGDNGLKAYDVSNEQDIKLIETRKDFHAFDVIAKGGLATITGQDGIFQFSYSPSGIKLVSKIPVTRPEL
jgi:hypothetical protein